MTPHQLKSAIEALLMVAEGPLTVERLGRLLESEDGPAPGREQLRAVLEELQADYAERGVELAEVAGGFRFRTRAVYAATIGRMWEERRPRYSRALLETLAIIAYRQPITRGEIEHIRGVAVTTNIMRALLEREWVRVVGHRDVPGRPSVYATTGEFLDYFGMKSLAELPSLADLKEFGDLDPDLFAVGGQDAADGEEGAGEPAAAAAAGEAASVGTGQDVEGSPGAADGGDAGVRPDAGGEDATVPAAAR